MGPRFLYANWWQDDGQKLSWMQERQRKYRGKKKIN